MEKLIELAIKYDREKEWASFDWNITNWEFENHIYQKYLISKEYWFIKWLVDNEKIETNNLNLKVFKSMFSNDWTVEISYEELILMLLAISDEPIEFLISLLKNV
jgi:hypothetical protein